MLHEATGRHIRVAMIDLLVQRLPHVHVELTDTFILEL